MTRGAVRAIAATALAISLATTVAATDGRDELVRQLEDASGQQRVRVLNELAEAVRGNAPAESIDWARQAADLAERIGDDAGRAKALNNLGIAHYFLADYQRALRFYTESLGLAERLGLDDAVANALNNMGIVHYVRGDHDQSIEYYARSIEIRRRTGDRTGLAKGYNNLGNVYYSAGRYEEALEYFEQSLVVYEEIGDEALVASSLSNMGLVYHKLARYPEAVERLTRALEIAERNDDKPNIALALNNLGMVADALGQYEDALRHHLRSLEVRRAIGDRRGEADCLLGIGLMYGNRGDHERSATYLEQALAVAGEIEVREIQRDSYEGLARAYAAAGDHERALEAHKSFKRFNDELFDEEADRRLAELEARYRVEAKDREIEALREQQRVQRFARNVSFGSAVLLLFLILLLYNRYRLKVRANNEIRRASEALRLAQEERERAARAELAHVSRVATLGEMASALAHELNQPLTAILGNAQATKRLVENERMSRAELEEALGDIADGAGRAREIIRRLRDLIRRGEATSERLDINDVLLGVEPFARADARQKGVRLRLQLADDLPPIVGDPIQLQQVMLNLVHNGAEAMADTADGSRELVVSTGQRDDGAIVIAVRDAGPPVDEEVLARMFEPFYTTRGDGLGMGLPICQTIVEAHGGRLSAERNPDRGMIVSFTLPSGSSRHDAK